MKTITCQTAQPLLLDYAENELDGAQRTALQVHLGSCPHCQQELKAIENLRTALSGQRVADPGALFWENFPDRVWQAYQAEPSTQQRPRLALRAKQIFSRWHAVMAPRVWVPALATVALVVGLVLFLTPEIPGTRGIASFQARIQSSENLAMLARRSAPPLPSANLFGFSATPHMANFFRVGHRYAESLAYAAGGDAVSTRQRLAEIGQLLGDSPKEATRLASENPSLQQVMALEPELVQRAHQAGMHSTVLFRAGGGLMNLALAVAARDRTAVREALPELRQLRHDLEPAGVAPGALRDLGTLETLLSSDNLSDRNFAEALRLIRDIQLILM